MTRSRNIHSVYNFNVRYVLLDPLGLAGDAWTDRIVAETPEEIIEQHEESRMTPYIERIMLGDSVVYDRNQNSFSYNLADS